MKNLLIGLLTLSLLLVSVVSCSHESPAVPSEVNNEEEARVAALSYIQANYKETASLVAGNWHGKDVTPGGLLGRKTVEFTLDDWELLVSSPVVAPKNIRYEVTVRNTESTWYWRGIVESDGEVNELVPFQQITQDKSLQIAEEFVKASPTFMFDGIEESLVLTNTAAFSSKTISPGNDHTSYQKLGWVFTFEFDSRHAGYGDRAGQTLAQVITHHVAEITVEELEVTSAIMDNRWDIIQQVELATHTESEAWQISEYFVQNSPTFQFDGMESTLKYIDTVTLRTPFGWQITFEFQSSHAGYGDRTGQMLAQVITPHTAVITVIRGEVVAATLDAEWNMLEQKMISSGISEEESRQMAEDFVENCPTFLFDGIEESLELVETLYPDIENAWQFALQFESRQAGYGDRTGQVLAEVITLHKAIITVEQGEITSAIMDDEWDMITQEMLEVKEISLAPIHEVDIYFMESYPVQVGVHIQGGLRDGCTTFHDAIVTQEGDTINIEVTVQRPEDAMCAQVYTYFEENLNLGSDFTPDTTYTLNVNDYTTTFVYR